MLELNSQHTCFGGEPRFYQHHSSQIGLPMRFSIFIPQQATHAKVPALFFLAGLTCNEETFMTKAGAQRIAAELGLMLIAPDTSPRGANLPNEADSWDVGVGAGFYLDAIQKPWDKHYRMYSYVLELHELIMQNFEVDPARIGITGHSMGGHGALVLGLRNPALFKTVSALAPICAPIQCPWGIKAFTNYLGDNPKEWQQYDASVLMAKLHTPVASGILIDQGLVDKFLPNQLFPEAFESACKKAQQPLELRKHENYDHGYYFIATFIEDHLRFHHQNLSL